MKQYSLFSDPQVVMALQHKLGMPATGVADLDTRVNFQKMLGVPNPQGHMGPQTITALQDKLGISKSGHPDYNTIRGFMDWVRQDGPQVTPQTHAITSTSARLTPPLIAPTRHYDTDVPTVPNGEVAQRLNNQQTLTHLASQVGGARGALIAEQAKYLGLDAHDPKGRHTLEQAGIQVSDGAWCSRFMNHCMKGIGANGSGSAMALSYDNDRLGAKITPPQQPQPGDFIIFNRGNPKDGKAHIATFLGFDPNGNPICLAGNQGPNHDDEKVTVQTFDKSAIRSIRRMPDTALTMNHKPTNDRQANLTHTSAPSV